MFTTVVKMMLAGLASTLLTITVASAHEVQPAVADISIGSESATVEIDWILEAPVAGLDLEGLADTNAAANADEYDRLRALSPADFEAAVREAWPGIAEKFNLTVDGAPLEMALTGVTIPVEENTELPRMSTIALSAPLPSGGGRRRHGLARRIWSARCASGRRRGRL